MCSRLHWLLWVWVRHVIGSDSVELTHFFDSLGGTRFGLMHSLAPRDMTHQHSKTLSRHLENDEHPPKDQSVLPKGVCERIILQCEQNKLQYPVLPASMKPKLGLAEIHEGNMSKRNISLDQAKCKWQDGKTSKRTQSRTWAHSTVQINTRISICRQNTHHWHVSQSVERFEARDQGYLWTNVSLLHPSSENKQLEPTFSHQTNTQTNKWPRPVLSNLWGLQVCDYWRVAR